MRRDGCLAELEPGHGWDWQALEILISSSVDAKTLGLAIANGYQQHAIDNETETEITLSVIDLTRIGVVDQACSREVVGF